MKNTIKSILTLMILTGICGCGLRKPLERPDPIFSPPPEEQSETITAEDSSREKDTGDKDRESAPNT